MSTPSPRSIVFAAAAAGATAVAAGAFGAHALRPFLLAAGRLEVWETAVLYHLVHAVAVLAIGLYADHEADPPRALRCQRGAVLLLTGIGLFSGSLYALAFGAPRWIGPLTPLGGLALIAGWSVVGRAFLARRAGNP